MAEENLDGRHRRNAARGPYGTNEGDMWLAPGSPIQERADEDGLTLIHEMMEKDGEVQEVIYLTALPELIEKATAGHELYMAARAQAN
jgi:hypothetical protein